MFKEFRGIVVPFFSDQPTNQTKANLKKRGGVLGEGFIYVEIWRRGLWGKKRGGLPHQCGLSSGRSSISWSVMVFSHQGGLSPGWSVISVISQKCGLSSERSLRVFCHQGVLSSGCSVIRVVSHQGGLSWRWSFISMVFHQAGDVKCLPPVWNLRAAIWFHCTISSLVLLPSPCTLSVLSFFCLMIHSAEHFSENSSNIFR